ncbi:MAG: hypothetical protein HRT69_10555 [Flavobacteriaceae bacterium]|nr:hypothetical protein [Flavobacteriaceae bacterium]
MKEKGNKTIIYQSSNGKTISLDDSRGTVIIEDEFSNQIIMGVDGITIKSSKDIKMKSRGKLIMEASDIVTVKGRMINLN